MESNDLNKLTDSSGDQLFVYLCVYALKYSYQSN